MAKTVTKTRRHKTEEAIAALLRGRTIIKAAEEIGVGYRTLKTWLASDWFRAEYNEAKRELLDGTINELRSGASTGVATLLEVARTKKNPPAARATAGKALVEMMLRAVETQDLAERLERLERAVKERDRE